MPDVIWLSKNNIGYRLMRITHNSLLEYLNMIILYFPMKWNLNFQGNRKVMNDSLASYLMIFVKVSPWHHDIAL